MATPDPIVLLHGFAGTGAMWDRVRSRLHAPGSVVLAPDLPGHGSRGTERPVTFAACVTSVLAPAPPSFVLGGYSLGGRVALHVALAAPDRVSGLVLIATTAGLRDPQARAARRATDAALADTIMHEGLEAFAARWTTQPLFAQDPPEARAAQRADIARQTPDGLAAALRGIGTGQMPPLWERLAELTMPVTVLVGERDAKYRAIGNELAAAIPQAQVAVVPGAGHGLPRETPVVVAAAIAAAAVRPV